MSDYELLSAFIEFINTTWLIFTTYVSIVFAFLVAGFLVSSRLSSKMTLLVTTIYTLVAVWSIFALNRNVAAIAAAQNEIKRAIQDSGSSLGWLPAASIPDFANSAVTFLVTTIAIFAYVGSVFFFFYQRKSSGDNS